MVAERKNSGRQKEEFWGPGQPPRPFQLQPEVPPQVLHFMQVPLRTSV